MGDSSQWRRCSACKKPIDAGSTYWACSVSTCNRKRTALAFCSVSCWEVHLPSAKHREAWAVERTAPDPRDEDASPRASERQRRRVVRSAASTRAGGEERQDVLIVASRLKEYVRRRSGFHTSDGVLGPLSDIVRRACDEAIRNAGRDGRRTVLDRDVPHP